MRDKLAEFIDGDEPIKIASEDVWRLLGSDRAERRSHDMNARMGEAMRNLGFKRQNSAGTIWCGRNVTGYASEAKHWKGRIGP